MEGEEKVAVTLLVAILSSWARGVKRGSDGAARRGPCLRK